MDTTAYQPFTEAELEAMRAIEADQDWHNEAQARIAHADALLERISQDIETVPAHARAHAADMLDSVIDLLERMNSRFSPKGAEPTPQEPPF
ncbi:hypothetical protein [Garicola koreensis]|uniref:Uncharacterized protein (UPF0147 family) n=1 Tax=Garicola koreensis TaxID=1262554 RepID=A0A7W5XP76_9MICC|nr:hypothetical protein [Garicola koreensis]MBB3667597.1 uncharacterized protein (UPF0147 family) [Garicola koreensis]